MGRQQTKCIRSETAVLNVLHSDNFVSCLQTNGLQLQSTRLPSFQSYATATTKESVHVLLPQNQINTYRRVEKNISRLQCSYHFGSKLKSKRQANAFFAAVGDLPCTRESIFPSPPENPMQYSSRMTQHPLIFR